MDDPVLYKQAHGGNSQWEPRSSQPPDVGVVESTDDVVSFKTKGDHTLIADGDYSDNARGFDKDDDGKAHNHYGPRSEGPGYFSDDRGRYTGPGH